MSRDFIARMNDWLEVVKVLGVFTAQIMLSRVTSAIRSFIAFASSLGGSAEFMNKQKLVVLRPAN
jgi:hypothetical protein